jgi:predicted permease
MNDAAAKRSWPPRGWTLLGAGVLLAVWAAGMAVAVAWGDRSAGGRAGAAFAGVVCLTGSLGGWLMARLGDRLAAHAAAGRRTLAVAAGLSAIAVRLALPLLALAWLQTGGKELADAGAGGVLLGLYLALLATDIFLTIMGRSERPPNRGRTDAN